MSKRTVQGLKMCGGFDWSWMEKWIRRRYKSNLTSASPQESFWRGRWIWIPIRKRIVHMQVICYKLSAPQISAPFLRRPPLLRRSHLPNEFPPDTQIKMQLNEVAGGSHPPAPQPPPTPLHHQTPFIIWLLALILLCGKKKKFLKKILFGAGSISGTSVRTWH